MSEILSLETEIQASMNECLQRSLSTSFHLRTMTAQREKLLSLHQSEYLHLNDEVLWQSRHFGVSLQSRHKIVELSVEKNFARFVDQQVTGPFGSFIHIHEFRQNGEFCVMKDEIHYELKYGFLGRILNWIFFRFYLRKLIEHRNQLLKAELENRS